MRTYLYKLTSDRGGAPCAPQPGHGQAPLLSLAICKPAVRRTASPGDRILGLTSRVLEARDGYPPLSIVYAATVTAVLDAKAYYAPESAFRQRPDCIYVYDADAGTLQHIGTTGLHADPRHRRRDLGREGIFENGRILLSSQFTYLGSQALPLDERCTRLREMISALGQGHRVIAEGKDASLDRELRLLFRILEGQTARFTPAEVHADSYDHLAPSPGERRPAHLNGSKTTVRKGRQAAAPNPRGRFAI